MPFYFINFPATENPAKTRRFTATMVEPTGVPARMEIKSPETELNTDTRALHTVTLLKLLKTRIADSAGKITNALIKREPTRFMARTIITAIIQAMTRL